MLRKLSITATCLVLAACGGGGNSTAADNGAVTAPSIGVQTQSSYAKGDQALSNVVTQVQQSYQQQAQNGQ
jgi:hypothetical protein